MPCFARRIPALRFQVHSNAATLPVPTGAGDGAAVPASWGVQTPITRYFELMNIEVVANPAGALTITAPALYGYDGTTWWLLGNLNRGDDIVIPAGGVGYAGDIVAYAAVWQRIAVAGTPSTNVDIYATPIDPLSTGSSTIIP